MKDNTCSVLWLHHPRRTTRPHCPFTNSRVLSLVRAVCPAPSPPVFSNTPASSAALTTSGSERALSSARERYATHAADERAIAGERAIAVRAALVRLSVLYAESRVRRRREAASSDGEGRTGRRT